MPEMISQRNWSEDELRTEGFEYYERRKQRIMAGRLPAAAAPMPIHYPLETVYAEAGDVIIFDPTDSVKRHIREYDHWSVKPDLFLRTYRKWDEEDWSPTPAETHLMRYRCRPYYKHQGVWARQLKEPTYILSLESKQPALVPAGVWVLVGDQGEPWHSADHSFRSRYIIPALT